MAEQCKKTEGHFDGFSFIFAMLLAVVIAFIIAVLLTTDTTIHKESTLPASCKPGQQILMTTAPTAELWVCESKWVRK